jgi:hypothetical protein
VPPNPQHSLGRDGETNSMPLTLPSRSSGLENCGPLIFEILAVCKARNVPQLLCRPTFQREGVDHKHVVQKFDQFEGTARTFLTAAVCSIALRWSRKWCTRLPLGATTWSKSAKERARNNFLLCGAP